MEEAKTPIKVFLSKILRKRELDDDEDILMSGSINSLFAMQLILFLEKQFEIRIERKDVDMENFRTINAIVALVDRKSTEVKIST